MSEISMDDFCEAILTGDLDGVTEYVDEGADVNGRDSQDLSPLQIAIDKAHLEIALHLIEKNAKVDAVYANGASPLRMAAAQGCRKLLDLVVEHRRRGAAVE